MPSQKNTVQQKKIEKEVKLSIYCAESIRNKYKAILAEEGKSIRHDILEHVLKVIERKR